MVPLLAKIFRGLHYAIGITAPPPGQSDRVFVFTWLGLLAFVIAFCFVLVYVAVRVL